MALDFNEALYLRENPDVCEAVMQGKFSSGLAHYHVFGRWEGRPGAPQIANLEKKCPLVTHYRLPHCGVEFTARTTPEVSR
jgi:hypothetical protein